MCRIHEGGRLTHVGVELRKGLYADQLDEGGVTLCFHGSGNLRAPDWEVTLTPADLKSPSLSGSVVGKCIGSPVPVPLTEAATMTSTSAPVVWSFPEAVVAPKRKHVAKVPKSKPPVRTKPVVPKATKPAANKKRSK